MKTKSKNKILMLITVICITAILASLGSFFAYADVTGPSIETFGEWTYWVYEDIVNDTVVIDSYVGTKTADIKIPSEIKGYKVTAIQSYAFDDTAYYNDESNWENDVLYIDNYLIKAKDTLSGEYNIKEGTKIIANGAFGAFRGCPLLTGITIPDSVTSIGWSAFRDCTSLTSITIPDSVTSIGAGAFYNTAYYNDEANWENDVLYIGNYLIDAKYNDLSGEYNIKEGTKTIAEDALSVCSKLTSVTIPNSMTSIDRWTFGHCFSLTSITIPDSVTSIGEYAFANVTLAKIYGYSGSYAETYANENDIPFIALTRITENETNISVSEKTQGAIPENATLNVKTVEVSENRVSYNITLTKDGAEVQPNGEVTVKIPVPKAMDSKSVKVYREESDGTLTDMKAVYMNGYMVFTTDHFSKYILEGVPAEIPDNPQNPDKPQDPENPQNPEKPQNPQNPQIPNTSENTAVYAVASVLGVMMIFAVVAVSVYKLRKKQFAED